MKITEKVIELCFSLVALIIAQVISNYLFKGSFYVLLVCYFVIVLIELLVGTAIMRKLKNRNGR